MSTYWVPTADCVVEMIHKSRFDKVIKQGNFTLKGYNRAAKRKEVYPHIVVTATVD